MGSFPAAPSPFQAWYWLNDYNVLSVFVKNRVLSQRVCRQKRAVTKAIAILCCHSLQELTEAKI